MNKEEIIKIANDNNGYLYNEIISKYAIPTSYIGRLEKDNKLKKVRRGIYITDLGDEDDLFIKSIIYKKIIYSGNTALFLNNLSNKQFPEYEVTIPYGYNNKIKGVKMNYTRKNTINLGVTYLDTMFGNKVKSYDKERCICDLFKNPDNYDYEERAFAINEYKNNYLNFDKLYDYAKKIGVFEEVKNVFEVITWN